ncbi:alpha-ketoglutarate-dependent sulfonate dioxygenase, partial [Colletotrichum incanum]
LPLIPPLICCCWRRRIAMPSFFKRSKAKEKEAEEEKAKAERPATPPPTYEAVGDEPPPFEDQPPPFEASGGLNGKRPFTEADVANITAAFSSLRLGTQRDPDVDSCLAHLKLLHAIQTLKEDVGYTDGLWDFWDVRAGPLPGPEVRGKGGSSKDAEGHTKKILAMLREKRWAVYLARAVDRYEAWWKTLSEGRLREAEMGNVEKSSEKYAKFPEGSKDFPWSVDNLPPLDVLMIWHSHMLNPRAFLEDTMRWGLRTFWTTGMPWAQVNQAIDSKFNYGVSDLAKSNWEKATGRPWDNLEEPMVKFLECPACKRTMEVPWTTCGLPETYKGDARPGLIGNGYGDGEFSQPCTPGCGSLITHRLLSVAKMINDAEGYLNEGITIPSSVLDPKTGMPVVTDEKLLEVTFPNRLVGHGISEQLFNLIHPGQQKNYTMKNVRDLISRALSNDESYARIQKDKFARIGQKDTTSSRILTRAEKFQSAKMMARYWENHSIFALDLVAATMRQGVFVDKMYSIDWLHSPNARGTMDRLVQKYHRFMLIMTENPLTMCVPTLDVDLAWHTHQLAPRAYYKFSTYNSATKGNKEARFIDHNDKVDEDQLSNAFEWTSKMYLEKFGEVYSECTCWYCEATRTNSTMNSSAVFGRTKAQKAIDNFNSSAAAACNPSSSAHVSAHNACHTDESSSLNKSRAFQRTVWASRLDDGYERAVKRAAKRGKKLPPKEDFYNHWGSVYFRYSPVSGPAYLTTDLYVAGDPGILNGAWADCAQGLCGANDITAGGCGGPGGCTNSAGTWSGPSRGMAGCTAGAAAAGVGGGGGCGGGGGGCGGGGGGG